MRSRGDWPTINYADMLRQDLQFSVRSLGRAPWLTTVIILTLAIVIAANTTVFSLLHAVLLRKLPLPHADELYAVWAMNGGHPATLTYAMYGNLTRAPRAPELGAYRFIARRVEVGSQREDLYIDEVSGGFFDLLGATPVAGRTINTADAQARLGVAVVSESYARRYFGNNNAALGRALTINRVSFTIIGVMPQTYTGVHLARTFHVAIPLTTAEAGGLSKPHYYVNLLARTRSPAVARASLEPVYTQCCLIAPTDAGAAEASDPDPLNAGEAPTGWYRDITRTGSEPQLQFVNASRGLTWKTSYRDEYQRVLIALFAGVSILLLIACANVATLLLARATAREQEFATRLSLGASRFRLIGQLIVESALLAVTGTVLGVLLARAGHAVILSALPAGSERLQEVIAWRMSPALLALTVCTVVACTILFGVWPARRAGQTDLLAPLKGTIRITPPGRPGQLDQWLLSTQLACTLILVCTAALFVATLRNLQRSDGGYLGAPVLLARIDLEGTQSAARAAQVKDRLLAELQTLAGVSGVALATSAPVINDAIMSAWFNIPGYEPGPEVRRRPDGLYMLEGRYNPVTAGYFAVTGIPLVRGREFDDQDGAGAEPVAVVSEEFTHRYFEGRDPLNASIVTGDFRSPIRRRIIGIVRDASYDDLRDPPQPTWYAPLAQTTSLRSDNFLIVLRNRGEPGTLAAGVRAIVQAEAPGARIRRLTDVETLMNELLVRERIAATVGFLFGLVALLLSAIGVYGLLSYHTARRTHEIGVRMALGAGAADTTWMILRQTLAISGRGLLIGIPFTILVAHLIRSQLYGVSAAEPSSLLIGSSALLVVAIVASLSPTLRATRVDPVIALRSD